MNLPPITEINFTPIRPKSGHIGFVSCVFLDFRWDGIAVYTRLSPLPNQAFYRLVYPTNKNGFPYFHPINKEFGEYVEKEISAYIENLSTSPCHENES